MTDTSQTDAASQTNATEPLRIGLLGAARISPAAIIRPAQALGHRLVAVGARDQSRADSYASEHGIERAYGSYDEVLADGDVEVIYNGLPNGLHGSWNLAAIAAGRHVLGEKPFASNAPEAETVRSAARASGLVVMEAFHYQYHPLMLRVEELLNAGEIGDITHADIDMIMPSPDPADPRWSYPLAGGSLMDVGCYGLHLARFLGRWLGGEPQLVSATAIESDANPGVDADLVARLAYPSGATAVMHSGMLNPTVSFAFRLTGTRGTIEAPAFVLPMNDDRLIISVDERGFLGRNRRRRRIERMGTTPTFQYQLAAFAAAVRTGAPLRNDLDDAVRQMALIDLTYQAAGMTPRPVSQPDDSGMSPG